MFKKYFIAFLFLAVSTSLWGAKNVKHDLRHFLDTATDGNLGLNPLKASRIDKLHAKGLKGRNIKIAVIDNEIHPTIISELRNNIHPSILQNKFLLTPEENFDRLNANALKAAQQRKEAQFNALSYKKQKKEGRKIFQELEDLSLNLYRKNYFDRINAQSDHHGVDILRILHSLAPQSQLFPFDSSLPYLSHWENYDPHTIAIKEAIKHKADIISLSTYPCNPSSTYIDALKEAALKGIAVIFAAGNSSTKNKPIYITHQTNSDGTLARSLRDQVFDKTQGKGLFFAGSHSYTYPKGEEVFSEFSQHPTRRALNRYLLAPGEDLCLKDLKGLKQLNRGTSLSAPTIAASYALLKGYADSKGLSYTTDGLLQILHRSGNDLHHDIRGVATKTYKSLNLQKAMNLADNTLRKKTPVAAKPQPAGKRKPKAQPSRVSHKKKATVAAKRKPAAKKKAVSVKKKRVSKKATARVAKRNKGNATKAQAAARKAQAAKRQKATHRNAQVSKRKAALKRKPAQRKKAPKRKRSRRR